MIASFQERKGKVNPWREIQYAKYSQTVSIHGVAHRSPALKPLLSISATPAPTLVHRRRHHQHHVHPHSDDEVGDNTCEAVYNTSMMMCLK